jgi:5-methyltetrahydrofolate--homocysteine methyltransferase
MKYISDLLSSKGVLLSDGAWGTMLQTMGLAADECPELWNVSRGNDILEIAKSYVAAGSDIIGTNTFGGNAIRLAHFDLADDTGRINRTGAKISRDAAGNDIVVMGSIGPSGEILMAGEISEDELFDSFVLQIAGLVEGGVDALCIETFYAIDEALIAIDAAKQTSDLEVICTFSFNRIPSGEFRTFMGRTVEGVIKKLTSAGVDIIGANCGSGIDQMVDIVREIRRLEPDYPILAQPNAGVPIETDGVTTWPDTPQMMASVVPQLIDAGANIVGGCCGTTPEHIVAMRKALDHPD